MYYYIRIIALDFKHEVPVHEVPVQKNKILVFAPLKLKFETKMAFEVDWEDRESKHRTAAKNKLGKF